MRACTSAGLMPLARSSGSRLERRYWKLSSRKADDQASLAKFPHACRILSGVGDGLHLNGGCHEWACRLHSTDALVSNNRGLRCESAYRHMEIEVTSLAAYGNWRDGPPDG